LHLENLKIGVLMKLNLRTNQMTTPTTPNERLVKILAEELNVPTDYIISEMDGTPETVQVKEAIAAMQRVEREKDEEIAKYIQMAKELANEINKQSKGHKEMMEHQRELFKNQLATLQHENESLKTKLQHYNLGQKLLLKQVDALRSENERLKQLLIDGIEETCIHGYTDSKFCDESNKCKWCIGLDKEGGSYD